MIGYREGKMHSTFNAFQPWHFDVPFHLISIQSIFKGNCFAKRKPMIVSQATVSTTNTAMYSETYDKKQLPWKINDLISQYHQSPVVTLGEMEVQKEVGFYSALHANPAPTKLLISGPICWCLFWFQLFIVFHIEA